MSEARGQCAIPSSSVTVVESRIVLSWWSELFGWAGCKGSQDLARTTCQISIKEGSPLLVGGDWVVCNNSHTCLNGFEVGYVSWLQKIGGDEETYASLALTSEFERVVCNYRHIIVLHRQHFTVYSCLWKAWIYGWTEYSVSHLRIGVLSEIFMTREQPHPQSAREPALQNMERKLYELLVPCNTILFEAFDVALGTPYD
ncbi:uncharacterized protein CIMG_12725 [Coccidioides immitis RS]|uniref:Uncharacterized protein n=1 Tax=Coccidioides immitis (strain RS) TaxID=246410 RepID=A0A0D8JRU7_COCIM|nr:uncharacterized protein CIMG_12725 [Coccidioides immitis RS]KJF60075.1 hypothetical protein CIMG_12725 [Coccidioides immitis RS]